MAYKFPQCKTSKVRSVSCGTQSKMIFSSAVSAIHISCSKCCLSPDVNHSAINHNCCTQRLPILHPQNHNRTTKLGQPGLRYESKLPAKKCMWIGIFKPGEPHSPWDNCWLTPSMPAVPNCCCLQGSAAYWSSPPFLIFDIRALWRSNLSAGVGAQSWEPELALGPERQSAWMSKVKNGGLDQYGKV